MLSRNKYGTPQKHAFKYHSTDPTTKQGRGIQLTNTRISYSYIYLRYTKVYLRRNYPDRSLWLGLSPQNSHIYIRVTIKDGGWGRTLLLLPVCAVIPLVTKSRRLDVETQNTFGNVEHTSLRSKYYFEVCYYTNNRCMHACPPPIPPGRSTENKNHHIVGSLYLLSCNTWNNIITMRHITTWYWLWFSRIIGGRIMPTDKSSGPETSIRSLMMYTWYTNSHMYLVHTDVTVLYPLQWNTKQNKKVHVRYYTRWYV